MTLIGRNGTILVDPQRCPALYRAIARAEEWRSRWSEAHGDVDAQHRLIRREYGLVEPMPEEVKAQLRERARDPEVVAKRRAKREAQRRLRTVMKSRR